MMMIDDYDDYNYYYDDILANKLQNDRSVHTSIDLPLGEMDLSDVKPGTT